MEAITKIFTTEDQQELKNSFKQIVCNEFASQLEKMDVYLFDPNVIEEMIQEAFEEVINDIKIEFKEKLREQTLKLIDTNDFEKIIGLKKKVK